MHLEEKIYERRSGGEIDKGGRLPKQRQQQTDKPLILDYNSDPAMEGRASEFIKVVSKQAIWDILEQGKRYAKVMEENGDFDILPRE